MQEYFLEARRQRANDRARLLQVPRLAICLNKSFFFHSTSQKISTGRMASPSGTPSRRGSSQPVHRAIQDARPGPSTGFRRRFFDAESRPSVFWTAEVSLVAARHHLGACPFTAQGDQLQNSVPQLPLHRRNPNFLLAVGVPRCTLADVVFRICVRCSTEKAMGHRLCKRFHTFRTNVFSRWKTPKSR
jgi:hypothetical protein